VQQEMAQRRKQKTVTNSISVKNGTNNGITNNTNNNSNNINSNNINNNVSFMSRQDSRLSVKSLIESIENTSKQPKGSGDSQSGSTSSLNNIAAMEKEQNEKNSIQVEQEKQRKTLTNNSLSNNILGNSNNMNGGQKIAGRFYKFDEW
jgi:hypothetical protein